MIKVLIRRKIREGKWSEYHELVSKIRAKAEAFEGFISGELLSDINDTSSILIIATWTDQDKWEGWLRSTERMALLEGLGEVLEGREEVECYQVQT